jgi:MFS family permease
MTTLDLARPRARDAGAAPGHRWLMLAVLLGGQFMALIDAFVVNVAMPSIGASLHASGAALQLVVGGYSAAYAMLLITGARLGDIYGRRRMYLAGVVAFTAASLACGLAPDAALLILARCVQGAAAAVLVPQILSVIQMRFTGAARATALSAWGLVLATGAVVGVILGGLLVSADLLGAGWRPVFLVNVPLGVLVTVLVPRVVPADPPRARLSWLPTPGDGSAAALPPPVSWPPTPGPGPRRLDLRGLAIAAPAVCLIVLPLVLGRELGWPDWTLGCVAAGLLLAGAFGVFERAVAGRGGDPLLNLGVLRAPGLPAGLGTLLAVMAGYGGLLFVFTLHLQAGLGQSALRAGLSYLPLAGSFGLVGYFWRRLPARLHPLLVPAGLALLPVAYLGLALAVRGGGAGGPLLWLALAVAGTGLGLTISPLLTQSLVGVPMSQAADASGLVATAAQLSQVIGVAAFGTVYLSLAQRGGPPAVFSGRALADTATLLALLAGIGLAPAVALARTVLRAGR